MRNDDSYIRRDTRQLQRWTGSPTERSRGTAPPTRGSTCLLRTRLHRRLRRLTTLLAADPIPPTIAWVDGRYLAQFPWTPTTEPAFGDATVEDAFGLDPDNATGSPGPFVRPRTRDLTVDLSVTRQAGFLGDGLNLIRTAVTNVVDGYELGEQVWANDLIAAAESIGGTRVTTSSTQHDSSDVSGVAVPLDTLWAMPSTNLTVTII